MEEKIINFPEENIIFIPVNLPDLFNPEFYPKNPEDPLSNIPVET